jgi:hypothetical protein
VGGNSARIIIGCPVVAGHGLAKEHETVRQLLLSPTIQTSGLLETVDSSTGRYNVVWPLHRRNRRIDFSLDAGGFVVSAPAALGDVVKPNSLAGLFGAAPSVAPATLLLTIVADEKLYAAKEAVDDRERRSILSVCRAL